MLNIFVKYVNSDKEITRRDEKMKVALTIYNPEGTKREEYDVSYFRIERPRKYVKKENTPIMAVCVPCEYLILYAENGDMFTYKYSRIVEIGVQQKGYFVPCERDYTFREDDVCKITLIGGEVESL